MTQAVLVTSVLICLVLAHGPVAQTDGISYYGVHATTWPILTTGFLVGLVGLWRFAVVLDATDGPRTLHYAVRYVALALPLLLLTPYNRGAVLNWAHMTVGTTMALTEFVIALALLRRRHDLAAWGAFAVQLGGGLLAAVSLPDWHIPMLLEGEIALQIGFGWSLYLWTYAVRDLVEPSS